MGKIELMIVSAILQYGSILVIGIMTHWGISLALLCLICGHNLDKHVRK